MKDRSFQIPRKAFWLIWFFVGDWSICFNMLYVCFMLFFFKSLTKLCYFFFQYYFFTKTRLWSWGTHRPRDHSYTTVSKNKHKSCDTLPTTVTGTVPQPAVPVPGTGIRVTDSGPTWRSTPGQVSDRRKQGGCQKQGRGRTCCRQGT